MWEDEKEKKQKNVQPNPQCLIDSKRPALEIEGGVAACVDAKEVDCAVCILACRYVVKILGVVVTPPCHKK